LPYVGNIPAEKYAAFDVQYFTTSATASYTLDHAVTNELDIRLVINNVIQEPGSGKAYTATGTTLTLSAATAGTDTMYCVYTGKASQTVNPGAGSVGADQLSANAITGQTALGGTPADTDELLVSDAGVLKRVDYSYLKGVSLSTNTNNQVATVTGPNALNGEANLRFDGSTLRVGSGTTSPDADGSDVVVEGSGNTGITILSGSTNSANLYLGTNGANNDGLIRYDNDGNNLKFYSAASERLRITSGGNVSIGTTANEARLDVRGSANAVSIQAHNTATSSITTTVLVAQCDQDTSNSSYLLQQCRNGGGLVFKILDSGNVQNTNNSYGSTSDERIKQDISDASSQWEDIKALKIRKFKKKKYVNRDGADNTPYHLGVVAQELEASGMNGLVEEGKPQKEDVALHSDFGSIDSEGNFTEGQKVKEVKYSVLYMKSVKALQEAITKIETLETENTDIKARLTALENA
jgi:hypothetical protein